MPRIIFDQISNTFDIDKYQTLDGPANLTDKINHHGRSPSQNYLFLTSFSMVKRNIISMILLVIGEFKKSIILSLICT